MNEAASNSTLPHLLSLKETLGITRIANLTHLDHLGVHVISCVRPMAKHLSLSQGKGFHQDQAIISGIMEAVEIYHVENPPTSCFYGSYQELKSKYTLYSPHYAARAPFDDIDLEQLPLEWIAATNLLNGKQTYTPRLLSTIDSSIAQPNSCFFSISTNGLAAGMNVDQALCHSLSEIIERDSLMSWQQSSHANKANVQIDLNTVPCPQIKQFIHRVQQHKISLKVWDITSTTGLPSFHCALFDANLGGLGISTGTGAHFNTTIALGKALTEAAQARLTLITGNRDDLLESHYQKLNELPGKFEASRGKKDFHRCSSLLEDSIDHRTFKHILLEQLAKTHSDVIMADLSRAEVGIPTVHSYIPDMHFHMTRGHQ